MSRIFHDTFPYKSEIENSMPKVTKKNLIWHYTNEDGANGIIKNGSLWASSILKLNDSGEVSHGVSLIKDLWVKTSLNYPREMLINSWIERAGTMLNGPAVDDFYVACAAKIGDSHCLSRGYGHYAVGFNPNVRLTKGAGLTPMGSPEHRSFKVGWRPVQYSDSRKEILITKLLTSLSKLSDECISNDNLCECDPCLAANECIVRCAVYMKDVHFKDEHEVRLFGRAQMTGAKTQHRNCNGKAINYICIGIDPDNSIINFPIEKINLGAGLSDPIGAEQRLRSTLSNSNFLAEVDITDVAGSFRAS